MKPQCDFDREMTFEEAVLEKQALPFLTRLLALADCNGILVGAGGEVLELNGLQASKVLLPDFREPGLPLKPTSFSTEDGIRLLGFPVRHEGEPIALLVVPYLNQDSERGIARKIPILIEVLESYFGLRHQQRMISEVHHNVQEMSYTELLRKNQELGVSEQAFRELAETLEQRVEERKKELEQAQQQLIRQEKMASIGQLAAGVAHEINNPTGFIQSNLATLREYLDNVKKMLELYRADQGSRDGVDGLEQRWEELDMEYILNDLELLINQSMKGTERITRIVMGLSRFSHVDKKDVELFDINALLDSTIELLQNEIKHKAELVKEFQPLPKIVGLPGQHTQVFVNLIVNALQSMEEFGRLEIRTRWINDRAEVSIKDNGSGIEEKNLSRLFDPFFTTKPVGEGTGLGLAISYEIVKNHGGDITVQSEPGKGSSFTVSIPQNGIKQEKDR